MIRFPTSTTNIIRGKLADFNTHPVQDIRFRPGRCHGVFWSPEHQNGRAGIAELRSTRAGGSPCPKSIVRYRIARTTRNTMRICLAYLQQEKLRAGSSLVEVLKNGKRRCHEEVVEGGAPSDQGVFASVLRRAPEVLRSTRPFCLPKNSR